MDVPHKNLCAHKSGGQWNDDNGRAPVSDRERGDALAAQYVKTMQTYRHRGSFIHHTGGRAIGLIQPVWKRHGFYPGLVEPQLPRPSFM